MNERTDRALRVLVAPSGFKGSLSAEKVAATIARGLRKVDRTIEVDERPLADGGEGTAASMARVTGGKMCDARVTGPVGEPVDAQFAILGRTMHGDKRTAVVDLASAAGLSLVPEDARDPLSTTSRGVGELICAAIEAGAERVIVGCGDSGVSDGGAGMASALGVRLLDEHDEPIGAGGGALVDLRRIECGARDDRLDDIAIEVACNMENVLTGEEGVARVYGPQKGAGDEAVERLADGLDNYARIVARDCGTDVATSPGGGASGGSGAGLQGLLGATLHSRFDLLFPYFEVEQAIERADLVITAEGSVDFKSATGKIPAELGKLGQRAGKPVIVLAGTVGDGAGDVIDEGVCAVFSILPKPLSLDDAMEETERYLEHAAEQVMRMILAGIGIGCRRG